MNRSGSSHPLRVALCTAAVFALALNASAHAAASRAATTEIIPQPSLERLKKPLPLAAERDRVDIAMPRFSNPTRITNPLFPISDLHSTVLLGNIDRRMFRTETTLLPGTKTIEWNGLRIECLVSQYMACLDGRIAEVALDWYAQADDGSVWYFGEDVYNYEDGSVADRDGTWIAGDDGPPAMIMPARPREGDAFRPENIPGNVFEEVRVLSVGQTVDGPRGRVSGAITTEEIHQDGALSQKTFTPGYGEFSTGHDGELEALAMAVPTDAISGPMPAALETLTSGAETLFEAARSGDWGTAQTTFRRMQEAWTSFRTSTRVPPMLAAQMTRAFMAIEGDALNPGLPTKHAGGTQRASLSAALAAFDLQLLYRKPIEVDRDRLEVWARQLVFDAGGEEPGAVAGDVTVLEWVRDRIKHSLSASDARAIDGHLRDLRAAADSEDLKQSERLAPRLHQAIAGLRLVSIQD